MVLFARFLTAEDFGVFAAVVLITGLASTLGMFGMSTIIIQRVELEAKFISTAFWISIAGTITMATFVMVVSEPISALFGTSSLVAPLRAVAAAMVISTASANLTSLLKRDLNMRALARRTLLANFASSLVALPFVLNGFGAWSLVIQSIGGSILTLILTIKLTGWPIRFTIDLPAVPRMLRFGAMIMAADFLKLYVIEMPSFLVGVLIGVDALGVFSMAIRILNLLLQILSETLTRVALPVLSSVNRLFPQRLSEIYLRIVRLAAAVIFPAFILVAALSQPIVTLVLGERWADVASVIPFLSCAGLLINLTYINGATLLALGRARVRLFFFIARALLGTVLVLLMIQFGLVAVGGAILLRALIVEPAQLTYLLNILCVSPLNFGRKVQGAAIASSVMCIVAIGMLSLTRELYPAWTLLYTIVTSLASYLVILAFIDRQLFSEAKEFLGLSKLDQSA